MKQLKIIEGYGNKLSTVLARLINGAQVDELGMSRIDVTDLITPLLHQQAELSYQQGREDALNQVVHEISTSFWVDNKAAEKLIVKIKQILNPSKDEKEAN